MMERNGTHDPARTREKPIPKKTKGGRMPPLLFSTKSNGTEGKEPHQTGGMGPGEEKDPTKILYQSSSTTTAESASFRRVR
jgi:hypothetical protein